MKEEMKDREITEIDLKHSWSYLNQIKVNL